MDDFLKFHLIFRRFSMVGLKNDACGVNPVIRIRKSVC